MATNTDFRVKNGLYVGENINALRGSISAVKYYGGLFDISTSGSLGSGTINSLSAEQTLNFEAVSGINIVVSDSNLQFSLNLSNSLEIDGNSLDLTDTGVNTGTYGSQTTIPNITIDPQGRITAASETTVATTLSTEAGTGIGDVDLLSERLEILGTSNEITTVASNNTITIGLPDNVTIGGNSNIGGTLEVTGDVEIGGGYNSSGVTITSSGNLSAYGGVYADSFFSRTAGNPIDFNDNIDVDGTLLVSGTISALSSLEVNGNVILGDDSSDTFTVNAQTINFSNIAPGTDNTVVVTNGSTLVTDEIDSRVWGDTLVDNGGSTGTADRLVKWSDGDTIADTQIRDDSTIVTIGVSQTNPLTVHPTSTSTSIKFANNTSGYHSTCTTVSQSNSAVVLSFPHSDYRSGKVVVQSDINNSQYEAAELLVIHDGSDTYQTVYGNVTTSSSLCVTYSSRINGTDLQIIASNACSSGSADVTISITQLTNT
tara:strand:- start:1881 stop:3338 length:1458 start_codon:yes stop_codon:yes gene_type:complete